MIKFKYKTQVEDYISDTFKDLLPDNGVEVSTDAENLNVHQIFQLFKQFLRGMDFSDSVIVRGAMELALNSSMDSSDVLKEYHLEDNTLEILNLKATISRLRNPDYPQYTEEEMDAMTYKSNQKK
jgi:hypothetical protein